MVQNVGIRVEGKGLAGVIAQLGPLTQPKIKVGVLQDGMGGHNHGLRVIGVKGRGLEPGQEGPTMLRRGRGRLVKSAKAAVKALDQGGKLSRTTNLTIAELATFHEFGATLADGTVLPERSFLRSGIRDATPKLAYLSKRLIKSVVRGRVSGDQALGILGQAAVTAVRRKFTDGSLPPNAPSTIKKKGSSQPLIDTGQLRASISYEIVTKERR